MKNVGMVIVIVVLVALILLLLGGAGMMGSRIMGGYGMMGGYGFYPLGGLLMLAFWLFIIGGIVLLVWWLTKGASGARAARGESAVDILKIRYAKGEITKEQFDAMKNDLGA